jgi:transcription elongation factor GreA
VDIDGTSRGRAPGAAELIKTEGLMPDGPVRWGAPVRSSRPGVFVIEFADPISRAPVDVSVAGKWAERVATLTLDGERPDGRALARRLSAFWVPSQTVLYVGSTEKSLGARVGALYATELGSRRPHSGGHWLKTLRGLADARVWWAETDAPTEYEDALLGAFAATTPPEEAAQLHDPSVVLPFANLQTALGERKAHGIAGSLLARQDDAPPTAVRRSASAGARPYPAGAGPRGATVRTASETARRTAGARPSGAGATRGTATPGRRSVKAAAPGPPKPEPTYLSPAGLARLEAELAELRDIQRPAVVARIKAARELGDLRENADYDAARREQSFIEGRVQQIEGILRNAHVVDEATTHEVILGSFVVLEDAGETHEYTIVGSSEADPGGGRISYVSPLGSALMGRRAGDAVMVKTPSGERHFRLVEVR